MSIKNQIFGAAEEKFENRVHKVNFLIEVKCGASILSLESEKQAPVTMNWVRFRGERTLNQSADTAKKNNG